MRAPFNLLYQNAGNETQLKIWSEDATIEAWLATERAIALAQGELGVIDKEDATAIVGAAVLENIDHDELWEVGKNVGYPILGLVRQISSHLPDGPDGRVHYGATTQDIMDTGLVLQMTASLSALDAQLERFGKGLAAKAEQYKNSVMAGRTHAQQAVPTTFGATLAALLDEVRRQRVRLHDTYEHIRVVSLWGAGGTNAAQGPKSTETRKLVADKLGLKDPVVPWHTDRDILADYGWACVSVCATLAKFARNIVDLSRTEIGEVFEPYNSHRGASSTMPQKVNPISSELMIGISGVAGALASSLARIHEAGHERAAGEWQTEWYVIPELGTLAGSSLDEAIEVIEGLRVDEDRMKKNLQQDGGLIMAEAQMIQLAGAMGREHAHDLVYEASTKARETGTVLGDELRQVAEEHGKADLLPEKLVQAEDYTGEAAHIVETACAQWAATPSLDGHTADFADLARD